MGDLVGYLAWFLTDMFSLLLILLQMAAALAWTLFVVFGVALPLGVHHGPAAGIAGGALVFAVGTSAGMAVLVRIVERHREARNRERARMAAELRAGAPSAAP